MASGSLEPGKDQRLSAVDVAIVGGVIVAAVLAGLWLVSAVLGVAALIIKVVVAVVVVVVAVRLFHALSRHRE